MKHNFMVIALALTGIVACKEKDTSIPQSQVKARVDSLVGTQMEELNRQAAEDLDRRMSIEIKAKADSLVQAAAKPDNTTPNNPPQP